MNYKIENTLFIGKVFIGFDYLESTNAHATNLLSKSTPIEGTVISTYEQGAGKGQFGSSWQSQAGKNLTLSVIIYPHFLAIKHQFYLSQIVCLSLVELLGSFIEKSLKIKWPNDIYVGTNKMAGILIENQLSGRSIKHSILGIGVNVNQESFPKELPNPTSLILEGAGHCDLELLTQGLCKKLEENYLQLKAGKYKEIKTRYEALLWGINQTQMFKTPDGKTFQGKIVGTKESGELLIEVAGQLKSFSFKQISPVFDSAYKKLL